MAYARFGEDSDIYLFLSAHSSGWRGYECCRCTLNGEPPEWPEFSSTAEVIAHIEAHVAAGQRVPDPTDLTRPIYRPQERPSDNGLVGQATEGE